MGPAGVAVCCRRVSYHASSVVEMSPAGDSIKMNPNFEGDLKRDIDAKAQRVVDTVARGHAGEPQASIKAALDQGLSDIGLNMPDATLDKWSGALAAGVDLRVDIHLV